MTDEPDQGPPEEGGDSKNGDGETISPEELERLNKERVKHITIKMEDDREINITLSDGGASVSTILSEMYQPAVKKIIILIALGSFLVLSTLFVSTRYTSLTPNIYNSIALLAILASLSSVIYFDIIRGDQYE